AADVQAVALVVGALLGALGDGWAGVGVAADDPAAAVLASWLRCHATYLPTYSGNDPVPIPVINMQVKAGVLPVQCILSSGYGSEGWRVRIPPGAQRRNG